MTSALLNEINAEEFAIIRLHEMAHIKRNDPLKKTLFHLLTTFFPASIAISFNQAMTTAMEQSADAAVANDHHDKAVIAKTLLKVRRLVVQDFTDQFHVPQICHYGLENIYLRIRYLPPDQKEEQAPSVLVLYFIVLFAHGRGVRTSTVLHASVC